MSRSATTTGRSPALAVYRTAAWSTRVDLLVTDPGVVVEAGRLLHATLDRVDAVASRFRPDSEVRLLQQSADGRTPAAISADLCEAVGVALRAARLTGGAVDPTVGVALCRIRLRPRLLPMEPTITGDTPRCPDRSPAGGRSSSTPVGSTLTMAPGTLLDLGATAKAWAADRAAARDRRPARLRRTGLAGR